LCFHFFENGFGFWSTGSGEVPPPAPRLLWFEKLLGMVSGLVI